MARKTPRPETPDILDEAFALMEAGRLQRAIDTLVPVAEEAERGGQGDREASARSMIAQALITLGRGADALPHATRGLAISEVAEEEEAIVHFRELLERAEDPVGPGAAFAIAVEDLQDGKPAAALDVLEAVLPTLTDVGDKMAAHNLVCQALLLMTRAAEALPHAEAALDLARGEDDEEAAEHFESLVDDIERLNAEGPTIAEA